jgi:hypothetical protein
MLYRVTLLAEQSMLASSSYIRKQRSVFVYIYIFIYFSQQLLFYTTKVFVYSPLFLQYAVFRLLNCCMAHP